MKVIIKMPNRISNIEGFFP